MDTTDTTDTTGGVFARPASRQQSHTVASRPVMHQQRGFGFRPVVVHPTPYYYDPYYPAGLRTVDNTIATVQLVIVAIIILSIFIIIVIGSIWGNKPTVQPLQLNSRQMHVDTSSWVQNPADATTSNTPGKILSRGECLPTYQRYDVNGNPVGAVINNSALDASGRRVCAINGAFVDVNKPDGTIGNIEGVDWIYVRDAAEKSRCQNNWIHYDTNLRAIEGPYTDVAIDANGNPWCPTADALLYNIPAYTSKVL